MFTFCVLNLRDQVTLRQRANDFVDSSASETRYLDYQAQRNDFVVFGPHLDLWRTVVSEYWGNLRKGRTAVRTLNSSEVIYRRSVASSFMVGRFGREYWMIGT